MQLCETDMLTFYLFFDNGYIYFEYVIFFFLSCRVVDLGVMVPCDQILREAVTHKAGMVF